MIHSRPIKLLCSRFKVAFSPFFIELNEDINRSKVCQRIHYIIPLISSKRIKTGLHDYIQDNNRNYFFRHKNHSLISVQHWYPCNFYTLSIALLFQVFHPNLELSSKHLELQKLHQPLLFIILQAPNEQKHNNQAENSANIGN